MIEVDKKDQSNDESYDKVRSLEFKYIDLLEKRIKDLETTVETRGLKGKPSPPPSKTDADRNGKEKDGNGAAKTQGFVRFRERIVNDNDIEEERDCGPNEVDSFGANSLSTATRGDASDYQLTWVRIMDEKRKYIESEVTVETPELMALLSVVLAHYPNLHFWPTSVLAWDDVGGEKIVFQSPFVPLIHNWDRLKALWADDPDAEQQDDSPEVADIKSRIAKSGPRTDAENQQVWALVYLGKDDNFQKAREQLKRFMTILGQIKEMKRYFSSLEAQAKAKTIQFDSLWTIFPPGEVVYSRLFMGEPQLFIVKSCGSDPLYFDDEGYTVETVTQATKVVWRLLVWTYDWNGSIFQRVPVCLEFEQFPGSRPISTLHCHPLRYYEGGSDANSAEESVFELQQILLERGKRFKELCTREKGSQMFDYNGAALSHGVGFQRPSDDEEDLFMFRGPPGRRHRPAWRKNPRKSTKLQHIRGRVMVDFQAYLRNAPYSRISGPMGGADFREKDDECRCATCTSNFALRGSQKTHYDGARANTEFDELQYMICPPRVLGYHLESKTWLELNVGKHEVDTGSNGDDEKSKSYLRDIAQPIRTDAFRKLQLAKTQKMLIKDLVQSHASGANSKRLMDDIMEGKGRGLVILLHGPPGVGKTLTAESVAQLAGKPLFSVGVSDIGLDPEDVERNLEALFELAANWRAVLLFDEADVFLESRSSHTSDLSRNALVSVLLRVLEYYDGILILTTNRIREFDIAVQSRVNLGIKYEDGTTSR